MKAVRNGNWPCFSFYSFTFLKLKFLSAVCAGSVTFFLALLIHHRVFLEQFQVQLEPFSMQILWTRHLETVNTHTFKVIPICWFNLFWINKHLQGKQSFKQKERWALMKLSANTGELTRTETVSPPTGNYTAASPFHPDASIHLLWPDERNKSTRS